MPTGAVQLDEVGFLVTAELGFLPAQSALGFRDRHAFPDSHPGRSASNSATMDSAVNSSRPIGSVGS